MRARVKQSETMVLPELMDTDTLRSYTSLGRNNAMKLGQEAGAKIVYGKRVLWKKSKIDSYLNALAEEQVDV